MLYLRAKMFNMEAQKINPFLSNKEFHIRLVQIYHTKYIGSGPYMEEVTRKYPVEEQAKVSMYKIGNNSEVCTYLFKVLSQAGRNLFLYIMATIGQNRDTVNLHTDKVCNEIGISRNTHTSAKDNLRDNGVISVYKGNEFWVNPFFIFRGDRIKYYNEKCPECVKITGKQSTGESLIEKISNG